jgi:hypothetical protein
MAHEKKPLSWIKLLLKASIHCKGRFAIIHPTGVASVLLMICLSTIILASQTWLDFIHLLVSPRRDAAEEYVKSDWKADFTYFPSAENIA